MSDLAGQYTQDQMGKATGGDVGFVQVTELSPELRENIQKIQLNQVKIIPGVKGLYIIKNEAQIGNKIHLRIIFLNTSNFDNWLSLQIKKFKVVSLLKI